MGVRTRLFQRWSAAQLIGTPFRYGPLYTLWITPDEELCVSTVFLNIAGWYPYPFDF